MGDEEIVKALELFGLTQPATRAQLNEKRQELLHTWNPHRFANHTNHPKKYMQNVKKAEAMTKEIEKAFRVLNEWLAGSREDVT
jgi:hypothetical protein